MDDRAAEVESPPRKSVQRQSSHFDVEDNEEMQLHAEFEDDSLCSPGEVFSTKLLRPDTSVGFGFHIDGGADRPYLDVDAGIFITHVRPGSIAEEDGKIEAGDKILEINGKSVIYASHDEVVQMFQCCKESVKLTLHKSAGIILKSSVLTEESTDSGRSTPMPHRRHRHVIKPAPEFSFSGFAIGIALGCVAVFAVRRLVTSTS